MKAQIFAVILNDLTSNNARVLINNKELSYLILINKRLHLCCKNIIYEKLKLLLQLWFISNRQYN